LIFAPASEFGEIYRQLNPGEQSVAVCCQAANPMPQKVCRSVQGTNRPAWGRVTVLTSCRRGLAGTFDYTNTVARHLVCGQDTACGRQVSLPRLCAPAGSQTESPCPQADPESRDVWSSRHLLRASQRALASGLLWEVCVLLDLGYRWWRPAPWSLQQGI